jgi:hypothetical protein
MKRLILSSQRKKSLRILGLLVLANLMLIGFANSYFKGLPENTEAKKATESTAMVETGWQVLNWSFTLLEYFNYEATN